MVIRALDRKLLRDLARLKTQALAIAVVVAAGMALFIATATTNRALRLSQQRYYEDYRFAQLWSRLQRAPERVVGRLAGIPGVAAVDGRLVARGVLDLPKVAEPASGLFIAIAPRAGHPLNDLYIRRGRHVEAGGGYEALVNEPLAERTGLKPGDSVRAVIAGHRVTLRVVGVALSPEFLMQIPPGGLIPDDRRFGVFWLAHDRLAELLDLRGAVNDVALRLSGGLPEASVIAAVDRLLEPYGGQGAFGRTSQPSHVMLEDHITPIWALAVIVPSVLLAVAVFIVNVVLSRLVAAERSQIGMLKAFGYSNGRLARHHLLLVLAIVVGGIILGLPVGVWLGHVMATWFATFFRFPTLVFRVEPAVVAVGIVVTLGTSALAAIGTLRRVVKLPPIVAMAPPVPTYRPTVFDRLGVNRRIHTPVAQMILRSVTRQPVRAMLTGAGMSGAIAILLLGEFIGNSLDRVVDVRFHAQERQDLSVVLTHARSLEQSTGLERLPGVRVVEPYRGVSARLHVSGRVQDVTLLGLEPGNRLRRIVDVSYRMVSVPPQGVVMSAWLASRFGVSRGESVTLEIREGRRRLVTTNVVGVVDEPLGTYLYMDLGALGRLLGEPNTFAAVNLLVDPVRKGDLFNVLKRAPQVQGVEFRQASIANFRSMGDRSTSFIRGIELLFAVIIGFGVVYNTARIAVAERAYDLATLRVLGFTRREISSILLGEIATVAAPAVPLGCALGYGLTLLLAKAGSTALFRFPVVLPPRTYAFAIAVFLAAALCSALLVRRRLDRLDLLEVLKARE